MTEPLLVSTAPVFTVDGQVKGELARDLSRLEVEGEGQAFEIVARPAKGRQ